MEELSDDETELSDDETELSDDKEELELLVAFILRWLIDDYRDEDEQDEDEKGIPASGLREAIQAKKKFHVKDPFKGSGVVSAMVF